MPKEKETKNNAGFETMDLDKAVNLVKAALKDAETDDPSILTTRIFNDTQQVVPKLIITDQQDIGLIMACFHALLSEIFLHDGNQKAIRAGMKKLVSMTTSEENKHAKIILTIFSEDD